MDRPWIEQYDEGTPDSIEYPQIALGQLLDNTAKKIPGAGSDHFWCDGRLSTLEFVV